MSSAARTLDGDSADPAAGDRAPRRPMWELAECNCPEFCERDHELD